MARVWSREAYLWARCDRPAKGLRLMTRTVWGGNLFEGTHADNYAAKQRSRNA